ncbi:4-(cytidine 5'-diphospho)-2-C-methyl-D-erythritol kinase [Ancylobacter sp. A5.8]|uniref:4-(cytidine 5'-diphospho)-2-C-methyl-D-erythritol kinase n=1 Tax=Ancylobacter gelatini TaxID=2919920 RepID=UPI001F4D82FC|nr:4-(cytidine 5'-diphospho)-2-C-methyl-D-erythritol kinase [Ancylobacter gelatini]MCJ8143572.1 4-(cytidine 5'-diphospho)-2-C-methyl-D-erythritol kinase [Ancylobacter gelatini]
MIAPADTAPLSERAPAKINLSLRVTGRRADGYHDLASLVAFAGTGDRLALFPGEALGLDMTGPRAGALAAEPDNLVLKAARELAERVPGLAAGRFRLDKRLPVASGIGGGSADAAAGLRLLARLNGIARDDPRLFEAALATGSDVPVCLYSRACVMTGRGEGLAPLTLPRFGAALVNPGVAVATAAVFRALALPPGTRLTDAARPGGFADRRAVLDFLAGAPNDLQPPAHALVPVLDTVEAALRATPEVRLVRMSGSGATMFALYDDCRAAARAAKMVARLHPDWWVKSTILG